MIIDFALIVSFTFHGDATSLCLNGWLYMKDSSNPNELWDRLFPLQVGTRVRVERIFFTRRFKDYPQLRDFVGLEGVIVEVDISWIDEEGWYATNREHPNAKQIYCYHVQLEKSFIWSFMREDLEVIK